MATDQTLEPGRIAEVAPPPVAARPRKGRSAEPSPLDLLDEPSAQARAEQRRGARVRFRVYCLACGRSTEAATPPIGRQGRCPQCGGTMLVELAES